MIHISRLIAICQYINIHLVRANFISSFCQLTYLLCHSISKRVSVVCLKVLIHISRLIATCQYIYIHLVRANFISPFCQMTYILCHSISKRIFHWWQCANKVSRVLYCVLGHATHGGCCADKAGSSVILTTSSCLTSVRPVNLRTLPRARPTAIFF